MRHWRWWVGGTVLVALLALLALALWRRPAAVSLAPAALTIATNTAYLGSCPVLAAQRQGYFTNQQLQVRVLPYSSGKAALAALLAQQADYATVAEIPVMFAALRGAPVQIFSTIYHTGQDHGVVARRDRGIRQASDLAGKRIGVSLSTSAHFALDLLLNRQRLDSDDVQLRNYPPEGLLAALQSGEVDAVSGWDPFLGEIEDQLGPLAQRQGGARGAAGTTGRLRHSGRNSGDVCRPARGAGADFQHHLSHRPGPWCGGAARPRHSSGQ